MTQQANPEMLVLARESRGKTQSELANLARISQGNISKYEKGLRRIPEEHVHTFAEQLDYPPAFFYVSEHRFGFASSCTYHRKQQTMPVSELRILLAKLNIVRIQVGRLLDGVEVDWANRFERLDVEDYDNDVERIAQYIRRTWSIPLGPIHNLANVIESAGGIVVQLPFGTRKLDALSQWVPGMQPVFLANAEMPGDRLRWTLAHELGHLIMHQTLTLDVRDMERQADRFAAEFLMPAQDIAPDLEGVTWPRLAQLKAYWKVSMASLIRRAHDLQKLSMARQQTMFAQMNKWGYLTQEPEPIPMEEPTLLRSMLRVYQTEQDYTVADLCDVVLLTEHEFRAQYGFDRKLRMLSRT